MPILINYKICDNSKECNGIKVCKTGALSYDSKKEKIVIDNTKCTDCGVCEKECPIGAIHLAKTDAEYKKMKVEIDNDSRTVRDLFVDRYGAFPMSDFFIINNNQFNKKININDIVLIELYNDSSIKCLLKSIPIKEITDNILEPLYYYRLKPSEIIIKKYNITTLPTMLVFKNSKFLGKIEGYYSNKEIEDFTFKLNNILQ